MYETDIQEAIDRQIDLERKAAAWDRLLRWASIGDREVFDYMQELVHPAQTDSAGYPADVQNAKVKSLM